MLGPPRSVVQAAASYGFAHVAVPVIDRVLAAVRDSRSSETFKLKWRKVYAILESCHGAWGWSEVSEARSAKRHEARARHQMKCLRIPGMHPTTHSTALLVFPKGGCADGRWRKSPT